MSAQHLLWTPLALAIVLGLAFAGPAAAVTPEGLAEGHAKECVRAYTPTIGPLRSQSVLPFTPCVGLNDDGCTLWYYALIGSCIRA